MVDCGIIVGEEKGRRRGERGKEGKEERADQRRRRRRLWCRYTTARLAHGVDLEVRVVVQLTSEGQLKLLRECSSASFWSA
jgi:hypothetical protein